MIILYIFAVILLILAVFLVLPITVDFSFQNEFNIRVFLASFKVFDSKKEEKTEIVIENIKPKKEKPKKENKIKIAFDNKKKKDGTINAVKYFLGVLSEILKKLVWFIKKIDFRHFVLNLTVSSEDAAKTAIEYGSVCTAVYPMLSFLTANSNLKLDKVNISADFDKTAIDFSCFLTMKTRVIILVIAGIKVLIEYKKLIKEGKNNE